MRQIKIYSTAFGLKIIDSAATTWGELQDDLSSNNVDYVNMTAVENVNNTSLVLDDAKLPENTFVLMLTPQKTKSGAFSYKELRTLIKAQFDENREAAKAHYDADGRSYTNKSTVELQALYDSYIDPSTLNNLSFLDALKSLRQYDELEDYYDLEEAVSFAIYDLESFNNLSSEEKEWIENIKNM